jgi:multiple sugar transport system ATP-binding protein
MRAELLSLHQRIGITTIYVTHDQTEAMTLGDRVVVMKRGVVQQVDAPERLYASPANTFVAGFIGSPAMNFLEGSLESGSVVVGSHRLPLGERIRRTVDGRTGPVVVGVRPEDFRVADGADGNGTLPAQIRITEQLGPEVLVHFDAEGVATADVEVEEADAEKAASGAGALVLRAPAGFQGARGDALRLRVNGDRVQLFEPATGESLSRNP